MLMKKLSKEQADWLIERINNPDNYFVEHPQTACDTLNKIKEIINQYTEKEFPEYKAKHINIFLDHNDEVRINIEGQELEFTNKDFKAFAKGCNKIVEYLDAKAE